MQRRTAPLTGHGIKFLCCGFAPLSTGHIADVVEANFPDGQIEQSCNHDNGAIHRDISTHPQQSTVEQMVNAPAPQIVDVTSGGDGAQMNRLCTQQFL